MNPTPEMECQRLGYTARAIYGHLVDHPGATCKEVVFALDLAWSTAKNALWRLRTLGFTVREGDYNGRYFVAGRDMSAIPVLKRKYARKPEREDGGWPHDDRVVTQAMHAMCTVRLKEMRS